MSDAIELDLDLACIVGILPRERIDPQPLRVQLRMELDLEPTATTGALSTSVDYGAVDTMVRFLAIEGRFRLIESMALALLRILLLPPGPGEERAQVARAQVRISKPAVLLAAVPSVVLARDAAWARPSLAPEGGELVDIVRLPEVEIVRWSLQPGAQPNRDPATGALLGMGGISGRAALPFVAPCPCTVLQVVRR